MPISLPSSPFDCLLGLDAQDEIPASLQADPDRLRPRETVTLAVEEAAEACHHADNLVDRRGCLGWRLFRAHDVDQVAGEFRALSTQHGEIEHPPGDDLVEGQGGFDAVDVLELQFLDLAA